jgi:hypothetical protein
MKIPRILIVLPLLAFAAVTPGAQQVPIPTNPHGALRAGVDCADCHTATAWKPIRRDPKFDHTKDTKFELTGKHVTASCARCHLGLRFDEPKVAPADCASCHVDVHRGNLPGACSSCHNTDDFRDVEVVSLHQRTAFPLTGAHVTTPCEACHKTDRGGAYTAVPRDCVSCHRPALAQAAASGVDHSGFPTDCAQCHATLSWAGGATFDHPTVSGGYVLEGAHARQRCATCHTTPGFGLLFSPPPVNNRDCIACHQNDYQAEHGGSGFPTTCVTCHSVSSWASTLDHDAREFPIYSGAHRGKWSSCATCHVSPGDFTTFTCLQCHLKPKTDSDHQGENGYSYDSQACYRCHPRGRS